MKSLLLKRIASDIEYGTQGVYIDEIPTTNPNRIQKIPFAVTLELPWLNNEPLKSCIPAGRYLCKRIISPKFGETFEITEVPHRTNILHHWGSLKKDTEGCILIGEKFGWYNEQVIIQESKTNPEAGFNEFMKRLTGINEFMLTIEKCYIE